MALTVKTLMNARKIRIRITSAALMKTLNVSILLVHITASVWMASVWFKVLFKMLLDSFHCHF